MRKELKCMTVAVAAILLLLFMSTACEKPEPAPVAYAGPTLASAELGVEPLECPPTGFMILEKESSKGRFPCSMAVARLQPPDRSATQTDSDNWVIQTMKEERAVYWTSLFNTLSEIREVIVLDELSLVAPDDDRSSIVAAAGIRYADLCLIYGPCDADVRQAGLMGVIVDTLTGRNIAMVKAVAGPEDFETPHADRHEEDLRHIDPDHLVARKFEKQVFRCVRQLVDKDQPLTTTQPSPWRSETDQTPATQIPVYIVPNRPIGW